MDISEIKSLLESGEIDTASIHLLELTESDPQEARAWLLLSGIAFRTEGWPLAEKAARALVRLRPFDAFASSALVSSLVNTKRYSDAAKEIARFNAVADSARSDHDAVLREHRATLERIQTLVE